MHNFNISICYKSSFFWSTNYKSNIFHFASSSPLCLPVVFPRCVSPFLGRSPQASLSATWIYSSTIWDVTYPRNNFVLRCAFLVSLGHPLFERKQDETLGRQTPQESFHLRKKSKKEKTWKIKKENFKT